MPPKTAKEIVDKKEKENARHLGLMDIPEDQLAKFHKMTDAKEMWNAIKSRFGGNDESKKMQKYILKQQFEGFTVSNTDGIHKGYERFQSLLSQLEIHGAGVSTEDANQKFLRSLPSAWIQVSIIMSEQTEVDEYDLKEIDLKWQVAMISMRIKKFYKKTGRKLQFDAKEPVGFDKTKWTCYQLHKQGICKKKDGSRTGKKEESKALVTVDGESVDWTTHSEDDENYAFMASNSSGSDTQDNPHRTLKNKGIIDSGCSRHMTGNKAYLADFQDFNGGPVAFGGSKGYITGKGKIKTGKLDFEDVSFVKELQHFNLFSVSQMCDKKNKVLFTDSECLVLSPDFKLT
ncbi:hypothetical protein Tco_1547934 [Tanacetum coccineum]